MAVAERRELSARFAGGRARSRQSSSLISTTLADKHSTLRGEDGNSPPHRPSETKFVPSLMAMDPISFATSFSPATVLVLNIAVAIMLLMRRQAVA
jgi:hypothetical protein